MHASHLGSVLYCDQTYKPSSVVNSHLSWPGVATTAHATFSKRAGQALSCFSAVLLRIGFTQPYSLLHAGELLPRLSILTTVKPGGISLLHYPQGRPRRPLAVILPCGARTFLRYTLSSYTRDCSVCSQRLFYKISLLLSIEKYSYIFLYFFTLRIFFFLLL